MSKRTHPWAAGVFDGAGWVKIAKATGKPPYYGDYFTLKVLIRTRYRTITDQLETEFKGHTGPSRKACLWQVTDRQAVNFLTAIKPYIVDPKKQKQIELGLAFADRKSKYRYLKDMSGQEKRDEQDDFRARLLEVRGRLPEGASHV